MLQKYTLTLLLSGTNTDEQNNKILKNIKETVQKFNGKITTTQEPYKRRLAFVIKKIRQAVYINIIFEIEKNELQKLNRELQLRNDILRFQINKYIEIKKVKRVRPIKIKKEIEKENVKQVRDKKINMDDLNKKLDEILETNEIK